MIRVAWQGSTTSHLAPVQPGDVRVGSFPVACGRFAPDGWDVGGDGVYTGPAANVKPLCKRCAKAER